MSSKKASEYHGLTFKGRGSRRMNLLVRKADAGIITLKEINELAAMLAPMKRVYRVVSKEA